MTLRVISAEQIAKRLSYDVAIPLVRDAMVALSTGRTRQLMRGIIDLGSGNRFATMPGALDEGPFGAKLISGFPGNAEVGRPVHQGLVVMFDSHTGAPLAVVDAGELTAIRTAAASVAATMALARAGADRLAVLGTGEQARRHVAAMRSVWPQMQVTIWGRDRAAAEALADELDAAAAGTVREATAEADIICTVSAANEPILSAADVRPGTHVNAVGSSRSGPSEISVDLVARARLFADHRSSVLGQGAEFLYAKAAGLVDDAHILGEIGEVYAGTLPGRVSDRDVTLYKSLGNVVQDLACAAWLCREAP